MPDSMVAPDSDNEESRFVASMLALASLPPEPNQWSDIRDYLLGIEAAVRALPPCDPVADELPVGFDPTWAEERA